MDPEKREPTGLQGVFKTVFPIKDFYETASLEFRSYRLTEPKYDVEECLLRGMTFAAPIKVTIQLVVWDVNEETQTRKIKAVKEQEVYFGEIPLMTDNGTFIINGTERVIVSQLHRSPGVFFDQDQIKPHLGGKTYYYARIIPNRGSWIDFEFDQKDLLHVRIDRRRKIPVTVFLRALKYTGRELLDFFYRREKILIRKGKFLKEAAKDVLVGQKSTADILDPETHRVILKKHRRITEGVYRRLEQAKITTIAIDAEDLEYKEEKVNLKEEVEKKKGKKKKKKKKKRVKSWPRSTTRSRRNCSKSSWRKKRTPSRSCSSTISTSVLPSATRSSATGWRSPGKSGKSLPSPIRGNRSESGSRKRR